MGTKTIGVRDETYERLNARKRDDESFTDLMERLMDEATTDWREEFDTLSTTEADELESLVEASRERTGDGMAGRQQDVLDALSRVDEDSDETA
jgi:predicted CopG family antitoxin